MAFFINNQLIVHVYLNFCHILRKNVQNDYRYIIWNKELEKVFGTKEEYIIRYKRPPIVCK